MGYNGRAYKRNLRRNTLKITLIIAVFLALALAACPAGAQEAALGAGARGEEVKKIQTRLMELNYLEEAADGIFGQNTAVALAAFQEANGLIASGTADAGTREALFMDNAVFAPRVLKDGDKGEDVALLQERLAFYGFLSAKADGDFGKATAAAVTAFQEHLAKQGHPVKATDEAGPDTLGFLLDPSYNIYLEDLSEGAKGDAVAWMQRRLIALNYMEGEADGEYGEYTSGAVRSFQRASALSENAVLDQETQNALFRDGAPRAAHSVPRTLNLKDRGASVKQIQQRLIDMGMLGGVAVDVYDAAMQSALSRMREHARNLSVPFAAEWVSDRTLPPSIQAHLLDDSLPVFVAEVSSDSKGAQSLRVQKRLNALGYLLHTQVDGKFGANSVSALKAFQEKAGLEATGVADEETQSLLFAANAPEHKTEYRLRVNRADQKTYVYQLDGAGEYQLIRTMVCSTGLQDAWTPRGVFLKTGPQHEWHYFKKFACWAQYTYYIDGDIMFHSVLFYSKSQSAINRYSVSALGRRASHGCVRLSVEDAKWLYETCPAGSIVIVE